MIARFASILMLIAAALTYSGTGHAQSVVDEFIRIGADALDRGDVVEAERYFTTAIDHPEFNLASDAGKTLTLTNLGQAFTAVERYQDAERLLTTALTIQRSSPTADKHYLPVVLNNLAMVYHATGKPRRSETLLDEARAYVARESNPNHPIIVQVLNNLGIIYRDTNRSKLAERRSTKR